MDDYLFYAVHDSIYVYSLDRVAVFLPVVYNAMTRILRVIFRV